MNITIQRFTPESPAGFPQTFEIPDGHEEMTVLDALNRIQDALDSSLAFRWSCRMGMCGSCGAMVNGKPVLMCQTPLRDCGPQPNVAPLRNFPVIKDLVVDISDAFEKLRRANPQIAGMAREAETMQEYRQTPAQLEKIKQSAQCIKCMLCYSACPVYGLNKNFMGPAAGALAYRYAQDSRNRAPETHIEAASKKEGAYECSFVGECSAVCPKRVDPALALQRLKIMGALHTLKRLLPGA